MHVRVEGVHRLDDRLVHHLADAMAFLQQQVDLAGDGDTEGSVASRPQEEGRS